MFSIKIKRRSESGRDAWELISTARFTLSPEADGTTIHYVDLNLCISVARDLLATGKEVDYDTLPKCSVFVPKDTVVYIENAGGQTTQTIHRKKANNVR